MNEARARWDFGAVSKADRLARAADVTDGKWVNHENATALLERVLRPGDRVCLEGNNQKQADFLAEALAAVDPQRVSGLHMLQSVVALPAHLALFEKGIAKEIDFSFSGPQSVRLASLVAEGKIRINAIHTYLDLFGRYFVDLTPNAALVAADAADDAGNLYTGPNTEDTPAIVDRIQERHRHRPGQPPAAVSAARRCAGGLGGFYRDGAAAELHRAAVHP